MNGTTFDALAATETLVQAGFDERQARAVAGVVRRAVGADRDTLATKADLAASFASVRADLAACFASVRADMRADLAAFETRFTVRLFGGLLAMGSLNIAAMVALKLFA